MDRGTRAPLQYSTGCGNHGMRGCGNQGTSVYLQCILKEHSFGSTLITHSERHKQVVVMKVYSIPRHKVVIGPPVNNQIDQMTNKYLHMNKY